MATVPIAVSLPGTAVSCAACAVALATTAILPAGGASLVGIAVALVKTNAT